MTVNISWKSIGQSHYPCLGKVCGFIVSWSVLTYFFDIIQNLNAYIDFPVVENINIKELPVFVDLCTV